MVYGQPAGLLTLTVKLVVAVLPQASVTTTVTVWVPSGQGRLFSLM